MDGKKEVVLGGVYKLHRANSFEVIRRIEERIEEDMWFPEYLPYRAV